MAIIGISQGKGKIKRLFSISENGSVIVKETENINAYLVAGDNVEVNKTSVPIGQQAEMTFGNTPIDGGNLLLSADELPSLFLSPTQEKKFIKRIYGSAEFIRGLIRYCLWIEDKHLDEALAIPVIRDRIEKVREARLKGGTTAKDIASRSHQFQRMNVNKTHTIVVPAVSSENRDFLPAGLLPAGSIISNRNFGMYDAPIWNFSLVVSRLHWVWIDAVCGKLRTDFNYSNTIGWNTFPIPQLTDKNKTDLTRCAENILLAREVHFPLPIADLYDPETMPENLRVAHELNDEVLERIFIGRRFRNDTERLERLFALYTKMTSKSTSNKSKAGASV